MGLCQGCKLWFGFVFLFFFFQVPCSQETHRKASRARTKDYQNHRELKVFRVPKGPLPVPWALALWRAEHRAPAGRWGEDGQVPQPPSPVPA